MSLITGQTGAIYHIATTTPFSGEAMTDNGLGVYTISSAHKPWDPAHSVVVAGTTKQYVLSYGFQGVDYAEGKIKLTAAGETPTTSGNYVTLAKVASVIGWSLKITGAVADVTSVGDVWKKEVPLGDSASITINRYRVDDTCVPVSNYLLIKIFFKGDEVTTPNSGYWITALRTGFDVTVANNAVTKENLSFTVVGQPIAFSNA